MKTKIILEKLTLKDVIETLVVYNIEHCRFPHNYIADRIDEIPMVHGMALDDQKLILIDIHQSSEDKREVIIHELVHTKHYFRGDLRQDSKKLEKIINSETAMTYLELYGVKP